MPCRGGCNFYIGSIDRFNHYSLYFLFDIHKSWGEKNLISKYSLEICHSPFTWFFCIPQNSLSASSVMSSYMAEGALLGRAIVYNKVGCHDLLLMYDCILYSMVMLQCSQNHSITSRCAELINQIVMWSNDKRGGKALSPSCWSVIQCSRRQNLSVSFGQKIYNVCEVVLHVWFT